MCIRDRMETVAESLRAAFKVPGPANGLREDLRTRSRHLIAVSYTHLRAHETVLDLVCRLLLDNKQRVHMIL